MTRQCSSCGGFCKKYGCERENTPIITSSDVIASLQMALSQAEAMIERQQHVMQRAMAAWDSTTHQKNGDGLLWQCMEELRAESHNAEVSGLSAEEVYGVIASVEAEVRLSMFAAMKQAQQKGTL